MANEAEELYALPLEEFTAARDTLARRLRDEGRRDEATAVAALRKPVVAAWVVNRLARDERKTMRRLVDAAGAIREGRDGADAELREALDQLTGAARALLEAEGRAPEATLQQVAGTLRAGAASDPDVLLAGTLTQPIEATGFGAMAGVTLRPAPSRGRREEAKSKPRIDRKAVEKARRALDEAREDERRLRRAASDAERKARTARDKAEAARERIAEAEARLEKARGR